MIHRLTGFAVATFWTVATSWLVWHDIVPAWTAQDPPKVVASRWVNQYGRQAQFAVFDQHDRRIGGIWTRYSSGASTDRVDDIYVQDISILGPMHIGVKSQFNMDGLLDEIDITVESYLGPVSIHGERFHSRFAFRLDAGPVKQVFKVDLALAGTFSDMFRPFDAMPNLSIGQSWRMQVFNPLAAVTGVGDRFIPMVVRVVDREILKVDGERRDCLIVQADHVRAWVDRRSGVVWVQELTLPGGSTYTVKYEAFDQTALDEMIESFAVFAGANAKQG